MTVHSSLGDNSCWAEGYHGDKDTKHWGGLYQQCCSELNIGPRATPRIFTKLQINNRNGKPQQHQPRPARASENSAMIELALGALGPVSRRLQTGHGVMPGMIHHRLVSPDLLLIIIIQFVCPATSVRGVQPTFVLRPPLFAQCNPVAVL